MSGAAPTQWSGAARVEVTLSRPRWIASEYTARKVARAIIDSGSGYTMLRARGGWEGCTEAARIFSICGATTQELLPTVRAAVAAAHAHGCEAVQVEWHSDAGYTAQEWRQA